MLKTRRKRKERKERKRKKKKEKDRIKRILPVNIKMYDNSDERSFASILSESM